MEESDRRQAKSTAQSIRQSAQQQAAQLAHTGRFFVMGFYQLDNAHYVHMEGIGKYVSEAAGYSAERGYDTGGA